MDKLVIDEKYYNTLNIPCFSSMLDSPTCCYKFYWLEAIVQLISENKTSATYETIINRMITNAWYPVLEYHIHLSGIDSNGQIKDNLERAVLKLQELSQLSSNASLVDIQNKITELSADKELKKYKNNLILNVPYRALSGFANQGNVTINYGGSKEKVMKAFNSMSQSIILLPYVFCVGSGVERELRFNDGWIQMIKDNAVAILGWIQHEKVKWLQKNNPEVPGMVYKYKMQSNDKVRKLERVKNLWATVLKKISINDIFNGKKIEMGTYDIDHFIPWSFVMSDELWNLMPVISSENSSKSNKLPMWDIFFRGFAENQYLLYSQIRSGSEEIYQQYTACFQDNLHSIWAIKELYGRDNSHDEFQTILEKNMRPVYDSAFRQGYDLWSPKG